MRAPMTHPDTDALAGFRAGLITGRRGTAIAAHLAGCHRCSAADRGLAEVSALLAAVPSPAMPGSVAQRLDAVLAAEAENRIHAERSGVASTPEHSTPERKPPVPPRARHHGFRLLSPRVLVPAAAVVMLAAGGFWLSQAGAGPGTPAASSPAAGHAVKPAAVPARPAAAAPGESAPSPSVRGHSALPEAAAVSVVTSPVDFTPGQLQQQLQAALHAPGGSTQTASARTRECVQEVTGGANPVRVLRARYEGSPATIIVTRHGQGYLAQVAGPGCSATRRDLLATATLPPGI
ncbi:MAG: hypothetical protein JO037_14075 [Actinobacteria bacterium]|nr:hypothetical protein [Actinomycetota bacterium]